MKNQLRFWKIPLSIICMVLLVLPLSTEAQTITSNQTGSQGGYTYEFWKDSGGSGSMTLGSGGAFSCQWSGINNILFRKGLRPGSRNQTVTYSANYNPSGNSYLCVYGWTTNPLVEYYIVESWGSWRPPGAQSVGTITSDGGTYELYRTQRVNQPSIQGTATFYQYWSVRTSKRTSGTITCANHFNAWESRGWNLGSLYEVSLTVEGYQSSGSANVTSMSMGTGSGGGQDPPPGGGGGGSNTIVVRARGTNGSEQIRLTVGGTTLNTWTLSTSYQNFTASTNNTGGINVEFINDASGRDVQVDYIQVNGSTRQAENQSTNTGVYQNGSCGGSNSEWMHCNGYIGFGNVSGGGSGGGSSNAIVVRARGTNGSEQIRLTVGGSTINTWTLSTSYQNFTANTSSTGGINVEFLNDASGRDVQVDYIQVNGSTRQAENQSTNTGVYQNGSCGGSNSEWLHCNGYIGFGNVSSSGRLAFSPPATDLTVGQEERDVVFVSPNPVSSNGVLKVDLRGMKGVNHVALTDVSGRILNESRVENKDEVDVHLNGIHPGLYILQVRNGTKRLIGKVLVK